MYYKLNDDNRIYVMADTPITGGDDFDFPEGFPVQGQQHDYKIIDGTLIFDPVPEQTGELAPTTEERLAALEAIEAGKDDEYTMNEAKKNFLRLMVRLGRITAAKFKEITDEEYD
ncbi:MAG: hypothetical protein Q4E65_08515 [Clostridia bacterium]|nr:hypothetical protein [Clostridia bacterium]